MAIVPLAERQSGIGKFVVEVREGGAFERLRCRLGDFDVKAEGGSVAPATPESATSTRRVVAATRMLPRGVAWILVPLRRRAGASPLSVALSVACLAAGSAVAAALAGRDARSQIAVTTGPLFGPSGRQEDHRQQPQRMWG